MIVFQFRRMIDVVDEEYSNEEGEEEIIDLNNDGNTI